MPEQLIKQILELEKKHKQGYQRHPVKEGEFDIFENEAIWDDYEAPSCLN